MPTGTVRNDTLRHIVTHGALALGDAPEEVAARARVRLDALAVPRSSRETLHRLWSSIVTRHGGSIHAATANALALEKLGPYGFAILTAPTGADALAFAAEAYPLINDFGALRFVAGPRTIVRAEHAQAASLGVALSLEATFANFAAGLRRIVGVDSLRLRFAHRAPRHARAYRDEVGARVEWDAPATELTMDARVLERVPAQADAETFTLLRAHVRRELAALGDEIHNRVVQSLARGLEGAEAVARASGASARSLRRKLRAEGTSFREVRDGERAREAMLLLDDGVAIPEIAQRLGFSEASAFARAFRRWTGQAPRAYRAR